MPLYEYKCKTCGNLSEVLSPSFSIDEQVLCSHCGGKDLERSLSTPSLVKGKNSTSRHTCCGRDERCNKPPCSGGNHCHRD